MKKVKRFLSNMDISLLLMTLFLFVFGLLNIVNASSQAVVLRYGTGIYYYFWRQLIFLIIGFFAFLIIIKIPTKKYHFIFSGLYIIIAFLLIALVLIGQAYLGSKGWIDIGPFRFQPSEMAKPVMIIYLAILFEKFSKRLNNNAKYTRKDHFKLVGIILTIGLLFPGLVVLEKDLGTALIMGMIFGIMFLASPIQKSEKYQTIFYLMIMMIIGLFIYAFASHGKILTEEQLSRFDFYNPCENYEEEGYQICNGFIAINSGGLFGVGIGNSKQVSYIPESHTDSVFAIVAEEYGFVFCTIIFLLYMAIIYRIIMLGIKTKKLRNKYICLGIGSYIALHVIVNLGGLFGSMPLTGIPLPFLSYGGTYTISLICSLAVIQRINIEKNTEKIKIR